MRCHFERPLVVPDAGMITPGKYVAGPLFRKRHQVAVRADRVNPGRQAPGDRSALQGSFVNLPGPGSRYRREHGPTNVVNFRNGLGRRKGLRACLRSPDDGTMGHFRAHDKLGLHAASGMFHGQSPRGEALTWRRTRRNPILCQLRLRRPQRIESRRWARRKHGVR